jgi:Tol biopolymer transport system component
MPVANGTLLGPYEIEGPLGAGGMGEVYRARDTRLGRHVAVKVLSTTFAGDRDRLRRFEQEARAVAALNHPNILAIHDVGTQPDATPYLVSELLEGESLRQRLLRGPLSARKAIEYGIQIAQGLSAAHDKGIVHRDLKPENLFLTKDGHVKILDFGLATLPEVAAGAETIEAAVETLPGTLLGTVGYMSPEQVRGEPADHRSDVFSLGTVLYEMFTGRRAFTGPTAVETMNAILKDEPSPIPPDAEHVPAGVQRILDHCLEKEPQQRFQSARDLAFALTVLSDRSSGPHTGIAPSPTARAVRRAYWLVPVAGLAIAAGIFAAGMMFGARRSPREVSWRVLPLTAYRGLESQPALSPDGNHVAFIWDGGVSGRANLYVRLIDGGVPLLLAGDELPKSAPTWSPDGKRIAFLRGSAVYLIPLLGGTERKLAQLNSISLPGAGAPQLSWSPDGQFIAAHGSTKEGEPAGIFLIPTEGGEPTRLTSLPAGFHGEGFPAFSPDGTHLAFVRFRSLFNATIFVLSLNRAGTAQGGAQRLTPDDWDVNGLDWLDDSNLVFSGRTGARFSLWTLSASGGAPAALPYENEAATRPSVARRGNRLAFEKSEFDTNVWLLPGPASGVPLTFPGKLLLVSTRWDGEARFSPDGKKIAWTSEQSGTHDVWVADADGSNQVQVTNFPGVVVGSPRWSPDGTRIAFDAYAHGNSDIYIVGTEGGKIRAVASEPSNESRPSWSTDGKWIYFGSNRSGRDEIWKAPTEGGPAARVTRDGGYEAFSSPDGWFLFYCKSPSELITLFTDPSAYIGADLELWKQPIGGGAETRVLDEVRPGLWDLAGNDLFWLAPASADRSATISVLHLSTGKREELYRFPKDIQPLTFANPFAVSSDARSFLINLLDRNERDLMLVENVR